STPSSVTARSTVTPCSPIGWQSGIRSGVRLAPAIPAMRATASASPFGTSPARRAATASADSSTRPVAQADRAVTALPDTSTIRAWPALSTCVSPENAVSLMLATILLGFGGLGGSSPPGQQSPNGPRFPAPVPSKRSWEDEDLGGIALGHLHHPLGYDDQRVGLAERGHLVRALAGERGDEPAGPVQDAAQEGPPARRRAQRAGQLGLDRLQAQPVVGLQGADGRPREDLERHVGADRVAGQREDRDPPVLTRRVGRRDGAEPLRHARLHGHLPERDGAE